MDRGHGMNVAFVWNPAFGRNSPWVMTDLWACIVGGWGISGRTL